MMDRVTAKEDRTGWFNRTGWPAHLAGRNRVHLVHAVRLPGGDEPRLVKAAELFDTLIERCVRGLDTLPLETRRWLKSAKHSDPHPRPIGRLQNPQTQARYAGYIKKFVCYFLRIHVSLKEMEEGGGGERGGGGGREGEGPGRGRGREAEIEGDGESEEDSSSGFWSQAEGEEEETREEAGVDVIKDARELFYWNEIQRALAAQLWDSLGRGDEQEQLNLLSDVLTTFIGSNYTGSVFESGLIQFTAVLGIDADLDRLRPAKHYSYVLAGLIYCIRVIIAEKSLPAATRQR